MANCCNSERWSRLRVHEDGRSHGAWIADLPLDENATYEAFSQTSCSFQSSLPWARVELIVTLPQELIDAMISIEVG